jgi:hypothetical protein
MKSTTDNVVDIRCRLRDGRAIRTEEDRRQWYYEYLAEISQEWDLDSAPHEVFPAMVRVMVEWIEATNGICAEVDRENVQALADAVSKLAACLEKCLASTAYKAS